MSGTRRKPGRMGPYIEGFRDRLLELAYTPGTVRNVLKVVGQLGRWMASTDVEASQLNEAAIAEFLCTVQARGARRVPGIRALAPLLDCLRSQSVLSMETPPPTPVEEGPSCGFCI
jgi:hypothetical protein